MNIYVFSSRLEIIDYVHTLFRDLKKVYSIHLHDGLNIKGIDELDVLFIDHISLKKIKIQDISSPFFILFTDKIELNTQLEELMNNHPLLLGFEKVKHSPKILLNNLRHLLSQIQSGKDQSSDSKKIKKSSMTQNEIVKNNKFEVERDSFEHLKLSHMMNYRLDEIIHSALAQLKNIKKLHYQNYTVRQEHFKGTEFMMKFSSGDSGGSEFSDFLGWNHYALVSLVSSSQYLSIAQFIGLYHQFVQNLADTKKTSNSQDFLVELQKFIVQYFKELEDMLSHIGDIHICFLLIDNRESRIYKISRGQYQVLQFEDRAWEDTFPILSQKLKKDYQFVENSFSYTLGEEIVILSPGVLQNIKEIERRAILEDHDLLNLKALINQHMIKKLLKDLKTPKNFLNEYFYILKKYWNQFLQCDSSVIYTKMSSLKTVRSEDL